MNEPQHERRATDPEWHLDKKVPLSLIFAMLVQAGMVIVAVADIKKDVEVLKADALALHSQDTRLISDAATQAAILRDQLNQLNAKIDRLIERGQK